VNRRRVANRFQRLGVNAQNFWTNWGRRGVVKVSGH
jgi:hypothetical protein